MFRSKQELPFLDLIETVGGKGEREAIKEALVDEGLDVGDGCEDGDIGKSTAAVSNFRREATLFGTKVPAGMALACQRSSASLGRAIVEHATIEATPEFPRIGVPAISPRSCAENGGAGGGDIDMLDRAICLSRLNSSAQGQQPDISARRIAATVIQKSV